MWGKSCGIELRAQHCVSLSLMEDLKCHNLWPASRVARRGDFEGRVVRGAMSGRANKRAKAKVRSRTAGGHRDGGSMFSAVALLQQRREAEALLSADDRARKCAGAVHG